MNVITHFVRKQEGCLLKFDYEKAIDCVNFDFLWFIPLLHGFWGVLRPLVRGASNFSLFMPLLVGPHPLSSQKYKGLR